ncbi:hypothetical protein, partial [uncultured Marinobacter sp.]|uniref:hypothetical protein n=1 Tax=uncultured Marinobacter sp. TaxID=187379 RepID=UPI00259486E0
KSGQLIALIQVFTFAGSTNEMVNLLQKIETWWFENFEMAIDPDTYADGSEVSQVIPGPVWSLQMLIDVALGPEKEARKYYDQFMADANKTSPKGRN